MEVSNKLAWEFHTILLSHTTTLVLIICFTSYIFFRAKKSPLLYSYLSVVAMISLWIIAKIFKTVSPRIELRWFFIVVQYFAIDCLGVCLLIFTYIYRNNRTPRKLSIFIWSILPFLSFVILLTNPIHMTFYSYFDIYKDLFGTSFYLAQSVHYLYLIIGIVLLSKGFIKQPGFLNKKGLGRLFALFILLPIMGNIYYILFKMNAVSWIFPFPVFDFTPLAASFSLMLFIIPTLTFRFFDLSPVSLNRLYAIVPQGLVFTDTKMNLYGGNNSFFSLFQLSQKPNSISQLFNDSKNLNNIACSQLMYLLQQEACQEVEIKLVDERLLKVQKYVKKNHHLLLCFHDITQISHDRLLLTEQNLEMEHINKHLNNLVNTTKALAIAQTKSKMAQNVHDILGHSLTVVIGIAELASCSAMPEAIKKTEQIEELLTNSLNDLKNALNGKRNIWEETTLIKALQNLKNETINVSIQTKGHPYELNSPQTEAIYRLCQEAITNAIKHGNAKNIYLILRFHPYDIEIYIVNNGIGCKHIQKNYGLRGIEERFSKLCGHVSFASDGESGFTIHANFPKQSPDL